MYPRVNTVKQGGKTYHYLQIVESYRDHGKARQRLVVNLGRVDLLQDNLHRLVASLSKYCKKKLVTPEQIECREALLWGPGTISPAFISAGGTFSDHRYVLPIGSPEVRRSRDGFCPYRQPVV